ncbi:MAG TPA: aromatic-ring-hydroxylating dioxygenase subunit beta [Candidatus Polarisedimenticolaceae bacterium]|nr:aromatic-ring-hydroxylating dioxygenase subunit beta [Candidatus Polarisedimenticolaceae bacterium]
MPEASSVLNDGSAPVLRAMVEDFLYQEAALLDAWRLDEWLALFTADGRYLVPTTDLPDGDPQRDLVFIDDDMVRLRARVERLKSRHGHREYPSSRTRRFISNIRIKEEEGGIVVTSSFLVYRFRMGESSPYVGSYEHRLKRVDGELKIHHRKAVLDLEALSDHGAVSIIL